VKFSDTLKDLTYIPACFGKTFLPAPTEKKSGGNFAPIFSEENWKTVKFPGGKQFPLGSRKN